jgi:fluoride exporter
MQKLLLVFIGGGLGSVLRYLVARALPTEQGAFPLATLLVNALGSLLIGYLLANLKLSETYRLLLAVGLCGGFTTFSTFAFESNALLQQNAWWTMTLYIAVSLVLCLFLVRLGLYLGK